jgi:hypothetical protein
MDKFVVNELLCYVQNNYKKEARALLCVAINGFYNDEEVSTAKNVLYGLLDELKVEGLKRKICRQGTDNKRKIECDDILGLFALVDNAKCELPIFVASDLKRVPTVAPGDVDIYGMASTINSLLSQVNVLTKKVEELTQESMKDKIMFNKRLEVCENAMKPDELAPTPQLNPTWAQLIATNLTAQQPQQLHPQPLKKAPIPVRVRGSASSTAIKVVPRPVQIPLLKAFVGRLDLATSEEELREFLSKGGLNVVHCRKLKVPNDKVFKSAAFYVACTEDCRENFYNEATWPEGVELRDWYTKS